MLDVKNNFCTFVKQAHDNSVAKGFWVQDFERSLNCDGGINRVLIEKLALIHTEINELYSGFFKTSTKIKGFPNSTEEMADILIRLADMVGGFFDCAKLKTALDNDLALRATLEHGLKSDEIFLDRHHNRIYYCSRLCLTLHNNIAQITDLLRNEAIDEDMIYSKLVDVVMLLFAADAQHNLELNKAVNYKMEYNKTRSYKHNKTF
jgi:hypothetical protein